MATSTNGVIGSDGVVPIVNAYPTWHMYSLAELFVPGDVGAGRYVPKVGDYVKDTINNIDYVVDHVDPTTLKSTLREIAPYGNTVAVSDQDALFGTGVISYPDSARLYVTPSMSPALANVDMRRRIPGTNAKYATLSRDVDGVVHVISARFDNSRNFIDNKIELEVVAIEGNIAVKVCKSFYVTETLPDNEMVYLTVYDNNDTAIYRRGLLVENTVFAQRASAGVKYITSIELSSSLISSSDPNTLQVPLNFNEDSILMYGIVRYSDGTYVEYPVDGGKFSVVGMSEYMPSVAGYSRAIGLRYALGDGEQAVTGLTVNNNAVVREYRLVTVNTQASYSVKLFGFPRWISEGQGYRMKWWLMNAERNLLVDVTDHVALSSAIETRGYGYHQYTRAEVDLSKVSSAFKAMRHVQDYDLALLGKATDKLSPWTISHQQDSARPMYGGDVYAKRIDANTINLAKDFSTKALWLESVLARQYPVYEPRLETTYPTPTHVEVRYGSKTVTIEIGNWNKDVRFVSQLALYDSVTLVFVRKSGTTTQYIAVAEMVIQP